MKNPIENVTKSDKPLISVLLTAYKEPVYLFLESLNSILTQTYINLEIIVIIDNPQDVLLEDYAQKKALFDKRIKIIKNTQNLGLSRSLNRAIKVATGRFVCRMDADDIALSTRIEDQLNYLNANNLDLVGAYVDIIDHDGNYLYTVNNVPVKSEQVKNALRWNNVVPHPTWFGTKDIFSQFYRELSLCEDYDFLLRAISNKFSIGNLPKVVLKYRMSDGSISRSNLYLQYLSQCILTKKFRKGLYADISEIEQYKKLHFNKRKAVRYEKANQLFNEGLNLINTNNLLSGSIKILMAPIISLSYGNKIRRLILASIYSPTTRSTY